MSPAKNEGGLSMPLIGMLFVGITSAVVVALCFMVIRHWPLPLSVDPYFGGRIGLVWGLVAGSVIGAIIGYLVDENHFTEKGEY